MNKNIIFYILIITLSSLFPGCSNDVLDDSELIPWEEHFKDRTAPYEMGTENLIVASSVSGVRVARLEYSPDKTADLYYPPDMNLQEPKAAVILVAGDSDNHAKGWFGRALKDTNQYLQWGEVIAGEGMIAVGYELDNPEAALEKLTAWLEDNADFLGIDLSRSGFFSINENGCVTGLQTVIDGSTRYTGFKPAFSIYYYGMMPLRSKPLYKDIPILTVRTKDHMNRGILESMESFNTRAIEEGALITPLSYPDGKHGFDCKEDTPEARELIHQTLLFMTTYTQ